MNTNINTTHATLKSLWNIPHIIRIPEPMPPAPEVLNLIQQRIFEFRIKKGTLDPGLLDYAECVSECNQVIGILENKVEELYRAFPNLRADISTPAPSPTATQKFSAENGEKSETTVANQHSSRESEVRLSETEVRLGETCLTSSETDASKTHHHQPPRAASENQSDAASENQKRQNQEEDEDEEDIDLADYLGDEPLDAALDLREYLSGRSPLDKLQPNEQHAILRLLEDHEPEHIAEVLAEPPPIGFGIQTSRPALYRFRNRCDRARDEACKAQHAKAVNDLIAKANDSEDAFQAAVQRVLKARLLNTTTEPNADLNTIDALITSLTKLRKQNLAERKQAHAEAKSKD